MGNEIKVGDLVTLKSGGPRMTVVHKFEDTTFVAWFTDDEKPHRDHFPADALERWVGSWIAPKTA